MKKRTLLLAFAASMLITAAPALAQDANSGALPPSDGTPAVQELRYVKFIWVDKQGKPVRTFTVDATTQKPMSKPLPSTPAPVPDAPSDTATVVLPCGGRNSDISCSGNVNIPVADSTPPGDDRLFQIATKLREYQKWVLSQPLNRPPPLPSREKAVQPKTIPSKLNNPAVTPQQNTQSR